MSSSLCQTLVDLTIAIYVSLINHGLELKTLLYGCIEWKLVRIIFYRHCQPRSRKGYILIQGLEWDTLSTMVKIGTHRQASSRKRYIVNLGLELERLAIKVQKRNTLSIMFLKEIHCPSWFRMGHTVHHSLQKDKLSIIVKIGTHSQSLSRKRYIVNHSIEWNTFSNMVQ